jgi:hypothetical protein
MEAGATHRKTGDGADLEDLSRSAEQQTLLDQTTDDFCALRNYGVSEGSLSVQPRGNPIIHSRYLGLRAPTG